MLLSVHLASWQDVTRVDPRAFSAFALSMIAGLLMCLVIWLGDTCRLCLDLGRTRRTHGVKQLLATVRGLYADLLWVWSGVLSAYRGFGSSHLQSYCSPFKWP